MPIQRFSAAAFGSDRGHGGGRANGVEWLHSTEDLLVSTGNEDQVTTFQGSLPSSEVCARIRQFGYAASQSIRIYGEEFDVLSDPFPSDGGIAIQVRSKRTLQARVLQLPATMIHRVKDIRRAA